MKKTFWRAILCVSAVGMLGIALFLNPGSNTNIRQGKAEAGVYTLTLDSTNGALSSSRYEDAYQSLTAKTSNGNTIHFLYHGSEAVSGSWGKLTGSLYCTDPLNDLKSITVTYSDSTVENSLGLAYGWGANNYLSYPSTPFYTKAGVSAITYTFSSDHPPYFGLRGYDHAIKSIVFTYGCDVVTAPSDLYTRGLVYSYDGKTVTSYTGTANEVHVPEGVEIIKDITPTSLTCTLRKLVLPSTLKTIQDNAIDSQSALESVEPFTKTGATLPSLTSIGASAFSGDSVLAGVFALPSTVTTIGDEAFNGCAMITGFSIPSSNTSFEVVGGQMLTRISGSEKTAIAYAPNGSTTMNIPSGVTAIGDSVFADNASLTSLSFATPATVTSIGSYAFSNCSSLTAIEGGLPSTLISLGSHAFYNCNALTGTITLPTTLTTVDEASFSGCYNLSGFAFASGEATQGDLKLWKDSGEEDGPYRYLTVPESAGSTTTMLYLETTYGLTAMNIPDGVNIIPVDGIQTNVTTLNVPTSVTSFWYSAIIAKSLTTFNFAGTIAQWQATTRDIDEGWLTLSDKLEDPSSFAVHCSDGDTTVDA
jgi:hypothetical protein